jgi:hypothetical protein
MGCICTTAASGPGALNFHELSALDIDGKLINFSDLKGKVSRHQYTIVFGHGVAFRFTFSVAGRHGREYRIELRSNQAGVSTNRLFVLGRVPARSLICANQVLWDGNSPYCTFKRR